MSPLILGHEELCEKVIALIYELTDTEDKIDIDTLLIDEGIMDSFTMVALLAGLEELLGIYIDAEDVVAHHFVTAESIAQWANTLARK